MTTADPDEALPRRAPVGGLAATRQARSAIADVAAGLADLHARARFIAASARYAHSTPAHTKLVAQCSEIEKAISEARSELIVNLMDAPPKVAGHSRVVDVEKSLDSLERALAAARQALQQN